MTHVTLPRLNQTGKNEWTDVESNDVAIREVLNGELDNTNLSGTAAISRANLASESKPLTWYTPKIIATEESRTNTAYGTLTTADEITGVVLPANGLMLVGYDANVKSSVSGEGKVAVHLEKSGVATVLKVDQTGGSPIEQLAPTRSTIFNHITSSYIGLNNQELGSGYPGSVTTGQILGFRQESLFFGGPIFIFAAAGTYNVSVRFKSASGSVTAKERKLWCAVLGY